MRSQGAASSIASGSPSRRAQISATVGGILRGQGKAGVGGLGARGEERDRLVARQRRPAPGDRRFRERQRRHRKILLARHAEDGPAGHERLHARAGAQEGGDVRRGLDDLLEVVEHQEQVFRPQRGGELLRRRPVGEFAQVQGVGDRRDDEVGIADRREGDEDRAVGEVRLQFGRHFDRQARLADPAGTGQRDEPDLGASQQVADGRELPLPADQRRERDRQRADAWEGRSADHGAKAPEPVAVSSLVGNATRPGAERRNPTRPVRSQTDAREEDGAVVRSSWRGSRHLLGGPSLLSDARRRDIDGYIIIALAPDVLRVGVSSRAKDQRTWKTIDDTLRHLVRALAADGRSVREIARHVGVSHETVRTVLRATDSLPAES